MVNISWFWHDHSCISTKKPIQLGMKLLKEKKKIKLITFCKKCSISNIIGILEETNNSS